MNSLLIVAGETSGEKYGARLVREFLRLQPETRFFGVGGPSMAAAGVEILCPMRDLAVVGIFEILTSLPRIRRVFRRLVREVESRKPCGAVLIDSPDFNLRLALRLQALGLPVLYYISPTVWAWRPGRLKTIKRAVDEMLLIFPFEKAIYDREGIRSVYVGHPLKETVAATMTRPEFCRKHGLDLARKIVTLLPGSRAGEIGRHMPVLAEALLRLRRASAAQFVLVLAEGIDEWAVRAHLRPPAEDMIVLKEDGYEAIAASDLVLSACGTANMETALLGTPFLAFYKVHPLTYAAGIKMMKISYYSIVNILAGKPVVPELIQRRFTARNLADEAVRLLESESRRAEMRAEFARLRALLGDERASANAARELAWLVSKPA